MKKGKIKLTASDINHLAELIDYALIFIQPDAIYLAVLGDLKFRLQKLVLTELMNGQVKKTFLLSLSMSETAIINYLLDEYEHPFNYVLKQQMRLLPITK